MSEGGAGLKKINSIGYGHYILFAAFVFLAAVPLISYIAFEISGAELFLLLLKLSMLLGIAVLLFLAVLLLIELRQDRSINDFFIKHSARKLPLSGGGWECQMCGSRNVGKSDKRCPSCGKRFME